MHKNALFFLIAKIAQTLLPPAVGSPLPDPATFSPIGEILATPLACYISLCSAASDLYLLIN